MKNLSIDIETFSSVSLQKSGVYKYAESPDFEILLFAYSVDGSEVKQVDMAAGEKIPDEIIYALDDESVTKWAFNAQFERVCLSNYFSEWIEPASWHCTMVWAATLGLPLSLEGVGSVLGLEKQKLTEGKSLIKYFCLPCNPTKANGGRERNLPVHDKEKWEQFKAYNIRDVETELAIKERLSRFPVPNDVWDEYHLDQEINDRGIKVDMDFVKNAISLDSKSREFLTSEIQNITGLENPNSVLQMKDWLKEHGLEMESLAKKDVAETIKTAPKELADVLRIRQKLAKSSVKKYTAMSLAACRDNRARGMFQFYGANRTGRFAGRIIQLQNLPQNHMSDLSQARSLVRDGNFDAITTLYDDVPDMLSQLIRTAFIPASGKKFVVADFSAIEARVLAWLSGERWRIRAFENGEDIYCSSASQMFGVPVEKHGANSHLRQKGKIAELALGYGGSVGALKAMGAIDMGMEESELQPLVDAWRNANPHITQLWWDMDKAIKKTVKEHIPTKVSSLRFTYESGFLFMRLPSGRRLAYVKPRIGINQFGSESVTYEGIGTAKKWERLESYGPKFTENAVQAIARDILVHAMKTLRFCSIVAHVHDEIIIEADMRVDKDAVCKLMSRTPSWADGLILSADGYECNFYKKD